jgi:MarR family 2-MHQ and catechol resistance regulon transcriptional repressor
MEIQEFDKLDGELRRGEIPSNWMPGLENVDPSTLLIIMWAGRLSRRVDAYYQEALREHSLQYSDYSVLCLLRFSGAMSPKQLNQFLAITSGGLTKTIQRLEKEKLVRREADPDDGRGTRISLSKKGEKVFEKVFTHDAQAHEQLFQGLSKTDRKRIAKSLRDLIDVFER